MNVSKFVLLVVGLFLQSSVSFAAVKDYRLPEPPHAAPAPEAELRELRSFSKIFVNIGKNTKPALVYIQTRAAVDGRQGRSSNQLEQFFQGPNRGNGGRGNVQEGSGSGFIVDLKNGYVITNNHVIQGATEIQVGTYDDRNFKARVVGTDPSTDVAVLKLEGFSQGNLKQVAFGDSDKAEVGDWVVALGAPFGLPQTLTVGVVSATGRTKVMGDTRQFEDFIQTDAAINPGNSGGPLLDLEGRVIGINTAILSRTGAYAGIGFAVPASIAKTVAEMLIRDGKVTRGFLGITMSDLADLSPENLQELRVNEATHGVLVRDVSPGSPAEKANIKPYDVITALNGNSISNTSQLRNRVAFYTPGHEVTLGILRDGKPMTSVAKIGVFKENVVNPNSRRSSRSPGR